ncbi:uncharacterized protein LOC125037989 [Penaeus chinensis]|uniref:uncharacterized protein LOC125037989 n=1 Tax=Penaeus chinensis TaxID=139456 RepID=UPI001FB78FF0|nr:uncharacterized protein LOC125037989 [Penaeus chinensis]
MKLLVISMLAVTAFAAPQGYSLTEPRGAVFSGGRGHAAIGEEGFAGVGGAETASPLITDDSADIASSESRGDDGFPLTAGLTTDSESFVGVDKTTGTAFSAATGITSGGVAECQEGEIQHVDGSCVLPKITRKVFVFSVPKQEQERADDIPNLPPPRVEHNVLFVRLPKGGFGPEPIVIPPPRQENIIYVLNKQGDQTQRVIEVPAHPPSEPEIYFVNYDEGDNPTLPGGLDLQTALDSAVVAGGQRLGTDTGSRAAFENHSSVGVSSSTEVDVSEDFHSGLLVSDAGRAAPTDTGADNTGNSPSGLYGIP